MTALLTWLFCSLLQGYMFYEVTNFNQNLTGWLIALDSAVGAGIVVSGMFLSLFGRVLHCFNLHPSH